MEIDPMVNHQDVDVTKQLPEVSFMAAAPGDLLKGDGGAVRAAQLQGLNPGG